MFNGTFMFPVNPWDRHHKRKDARFRNNREFNNWFAYLSNLYLNLFEWKGFPETVNTRFLEETLYCDAKALIFEDKSLGMLGLPCSGEGNLNVYWEYTKYRVSSNMYHATIDADKATLIRENQLIYPPIFMIEIWAGKIADAGRTIDVYSKTMKKPWLATCENDDKLTYKTLIDDIEQNELLVVGDKRISAENLSIYPNRQDGQGLLSLWRHKHELLDECLTWFGINNANTEKRERLIESEVESNNQLIQLNVDSALDWRKRAAEEINKKFDLNVTVELKHDYITEEKEGMEDEQNNGNSRGDSKQ